jgi:ABC-type dipeptide/oligopeptide/nickel transport system permease component
MWLSTPRFMAGLVLLLLLGAACAWLNNLGRVTDGQSQAVYGLISLLIVIGIVVRARARWGRWVAAQTRK